MRRIETTNYLYKYEISPSERQLLTSLLYDRYKTITGNFKEINRKKLENQIELDCLKRKKKKLSYQTLRRLSGLNSGMFSQDTMDSVLAFLDVNSFEDLNLSMQNIMGQNVAEKKPLNVNSFLWPHIINIEFKNRQKLKLQYISGDKFEVLRSTIANIKEHNRLEIYQLILNQGFQCQVELRVPHPEFVNMKESVWIYTRESKFDSSDYNNPLAKIWFEERPVDFSMVKGNNRNHLNDILIPVSSNKNPLHTLPANANALWYCSAGVDFRSLVYFSEGHLNKLYEDNNKMLQAPDLFVFNCLGREVSELKNNLQQENFVEIYKDDKTCITAKNYTEYALNKGKVEFKISPSNFHMGLMPELNPNAQAFYFEVTINSFLFSNTYPVLYFEMENHNFFNQVVLGQYFNVKYFCSTREGVAWGGNKKSMVKEIYQNNNPLYYAQKGFKPELIIHDGGTANTALCVAEEKSDIQFAANYLSYFSRTLFPENTYRSKFWGITKIDYPENISGVTKKYPEPKKEPADS